MNYSKLASELLGTADKTILSNQQSQYFRSIIESLPKDDQAMLENDSDGNPSIHRAMIIRDLRKDEHLMTILNLGNMSTNSLLDALTCFISEDYVFSIKVDSDNPCTTQLIFAPIEDDEVFSEDTYEFLKAKIAKGKLTFDEKHFAKTGEERYLDKNGDPADLIYGKILAEKSNTTSDAVWLQLKPEENKIFSNSDIPTNGELLQYILSFSETKSRKLFGDARFDSIIFYFTYWLGNDFNAHVDISDF